MQNLSLSSNSEDHLYFSLLTHFDSVAYSKIIEAKNVVINYEMLNLLRKKRVLI